MIFIFEVTGVKEALRVFKEKSEENKNTVVQLILEENNIGEEESYEQQCF